MAFPKQIFMKLTNFQQHCEQISYIEFCPNLTTDVQSMDTNSLTLWSKVWLPLLQFSRNLQLHNKFCRHLLYRIWSTVEEKCSKYG